MAHFSKVVDRFLGFVKVTLKEEAFDFALWFSTVRLKMRAGLSRGPVNRLRDLAPSLEGSGHTRTALPFCGQISLLLLSGDLTKVVKWAAACITMQIKKVPLVHNCFYQKFYHLC